MTAVHNDSYTDARDDLKNLLDAAESGMVAHGTAANPLPRPSLMLAASGISSHRTGTHHVTGEVSRTAPAPSWPAPRIRRS